VEFKKGILFGVLDCEGNNLKAKNVKSKKEFFKQGNGEGSKKGIF
jgi:hypothetical protein